MEATEGAIGFAVQKALLDAAVPLVPEGAAVCLMADRFYGTADLIAWCQDRSWDDRLRLKGNLGIRDAAGPGEYPEFRARRGYPEAEGGPEWPDAKN